MLMPKRTKYRRMHRGRRKGVAARGTEVNFGQFALVAQGTCWLESRQIEAARRVITRYTRRGGKLWIRVFPDKVVTAKPAETRMGKGKGAPDHWVAVVKPGRILFEIAGVREDVAKEAMRLAGYKLPIPTKFLAKPVPATAQDEEQAARIAVAAIREEEGRGDVERASELREKSTLELHELLTAAQQETVTVRFQVATRQMGNYARLRQLRREIARLNFLLHERALAEAEAAYADANG